MVALGLDMNEYYFPSEKPVTCLSDLVTVLLDQRWLDLEAALKHGSKACILWRRSSGLKMHDFLLWGHRIRYLLPLIESPFDC